MKAISAPEHSRFEHFGRQFQHSVPAAAAATAAATATATAAAGGGFGGANLLQFITTLYLPPV